MFWSAVIALSCLVAYAHGHGRLDVPANRASLWRTGLFSDAPPNYDDDGLNCGGFYHQHSVNGGRCGICGDAYDNAQPRAHELGGKYGQGHIVATYEQGEVISTKVYISAYHQGYWEFRLCLDPSDQTQECFANFLLELEDGGTKYYPKGTGYYDVNYRLPSNVVCEHCVLQWKYTAGNNWGVCADGTGALGCGDQENFFSCSDISIKGSESIPLDVPIVNLNDILRLLILTNQIRDVRPSYSFSPSRKKYMNRHKRKKLNKKTKLKAKRGHKKFTYHR